MKRLDQRDVKKANLGGIRAPGIHVWIVLYDPLNLGNGSALTVQVTNSTKSRRARPDCAVLYEN